MSVRMSVENGKFGYVGEDDVFHGFSSVEEKAEAKRLALAAKPREDEDKDVYH